MLATAFAYCVDVPINNPMQNLTTAKFHYLPADIKADYIKASKALLFAEADLARIKDDLTSSDGDIYTAEVARSIALTAFLKANKARDEAAQVANKGV